ncbi:ATP-dependent DNA ligase [uncultured virus]|nr:ATP-dependent DNA ligase [uncultured virus]
MFKKDGSASKLTPHDKPVEQNRNTDNLYDAAKLFATQKWNQKQRREGYRPSKVPPEIDGADDWRATHGSVHYPALSKKWEDCLETHSDSLGCSERDPWYAQGKCNGDRQMAWLVDDEVILYARKVTEVPFRDAARDQCRDVFEYIAQTWPELGDVGLDGEVFVPGVSHQESRKILGHKKTKSEDDDRVVFFIFDIMEYTLPFKKRYPIVDKLAAHFGTSLPNIAFLGTSVLTADSDIDVYLKMCEDAGFDEGIILRRGDLMYSRKKEHKHCEMIKVKNWNDEEYEVIGYKEGTGSRDDCVVWQLRDLERKDIVFWCSMKGDVPTLKWYYEHGDDFIGRLATVRYTELTDDGIPKMAFVTHFREEDDLPDRRTRSEDMERVVKLERS